MANRSSDRPDFWTSWLDEIKADLEEAGPVALIPSKPLLALGIGALAAWSLPEKLWDRENWGAIVTMYGALLTLNGLLLALSWGAFARVQETMCKPGFSEYLTTKNLTEGYIFYINFINAALIISTLCTATCLVLCCAAIGIDMQKVLCALGLGAALYALYRAAGSVKLMQDLVWSYSVFDGEKFDSNVTRLRQR